MSKTLSEIISARLEEEKANALAEIGKMERAGILSPDGNGGEDAECSIESVSSLRTKIEMICNSQLKIAVCGVVKAGKSTFLNALLFGQDVLPTFVTPCTAKLTFITHSDDKTGFAAKFYTKAEFEDMRNRLDDETKQKLADSCQRSYREGVSPQQMWGKESSVSDNDFNNLRKGLQEYASESGKYTPYVKEITIKINRPELRNLYIVDTPGLDDPNQLNSFQTEQWADQAHAVVFLMPWKGPGKEDKQFIERHFGTMSDGSKNRLFVLTKIDQEPKWIDTLDQFKKDFPNEKQNVCGYSSLLVLLKSQCERGEKLNADDQWYLDNHKDIDPDPSNVGKLITERLFSGDAKVDRLRQIIVDCYNRFVDGCQDRVADVEQSLKNAEMDKEQAIEAAEKLRRLREKIQNAGEASTKRALDFFTNGEINKGESERDSIVDEVNRIVRREFERCRSDSDIVPAVRQARIETIRCMRAHAAQLFQSKKDDVKEAFEDLVMNIGEMTTEAGCDNYVRQPDMTRIVDVAVRRCDAIDMEIDEDKVEQGIDYWLFTSTRTNANNIASAFRELAQKTIDNLKQSINEFNQFCRSEIKGYVASMLAEIEKRIDEMHDGASLAPDKAKRRVTEIQARLEDARNRLKDAEKARAACSL